MIEFETITLKNFMSYGNAPTTVTLNLGKILITGDNGTGKSSAFEALVYVLFGKPFRKINIPQLVNQINGKDCVVETTFKINNVKYKVKRGMKPAVFEIYQDDVLIKQEAATKDYQGYLEKHILKVSYRTFVQVLVLGSASFTPFMQQPAGQRREIIEDILDISVFSQMQKLLKERITATKDELRLIDIEIDFSKKESVQQKRLIDTLSEKTKDIITELNEELETSRQKLFALRESRSLLSDQFSSQQEKLIHLDDSELDTIQHEFSILSREMKTISQKINSIQSIDECPTCLQNVGSTHKEKIKVQLDEDLQTKSVSSDKIAERIESLKIIKQNRDDILVEIRNLGSEIKTADILISSQEDTVAQIEQKIKQQQQNQLGDIEKEKTKLKEIAKKALKLIERKAELTHEKALHEVQLGLLKDTGIKAQIVREYLPILNKLINKYLTEFDFFVNFELDENFNEKIRSRGRDQFQYYSFSEGEKKRIDLSILMAFRQIAGMKNSAKINLLLQDEIDSGMDMFSVEKYVELLGRLDCNAWVISHVIANTELINHFDKIAEVQKISDFQTLVIK